jgi:hypothetical protein
MTCKSLALDACHDDSTAFKFIIQQIESLGKRLGYKTKFIYNILNSFILLLISYTILRLYIYYDTGESVLSMSGFIIVLDVNLIQFIFYAFLCFKKSRLFKSDYFLVDKI